MAPGRWAPFIRVVIPAAVPGIVAVGIYAFMTAWSENGTRTRSWPG